MFKRVTLGVIVIVAIVRDIASPNKCKVSVMKITEKQSVRESEKQTYGNKQGAGTIPKWLRSLGVLGSIPLS